MAYNVMTYNQYIAIACRDILDARLEAFGYLMRHKKAEIYIKDFSNGREGGLVGIVFWSKEKDRYGDVLGPCYYSDKTNKEYLLDLDGKIFDKKTNRRVPGQYRRKSKR